MLSLSHTHTHSLSHACTQAHTCTRTLTHTHTHTNTHTNWQRDYQLDSRDPVDKVTEVELVFMTTLGHKYFCIIILSLFKQSTSQEEMRRRKNRTLGDTDMPVQEHLVRHTYRYMSGALSLTSRHRRVHSHQQSQEVVVSEYFYKVKGEVYPKIKFSLVVVFGVLSRMVLVRGS